jgi:hypothetical protein
MSQQWHYIPAPLDVVQALMDRAWDDDISRDVHGWHFDWCKSQKGHET